MKSVHGLTLIELRIVVAIVVSLATIAFPVHQDYVVRLQATSALAEIVPSKVVFELALQQNRTPSLAATGDGFIGITEAMNYCDIALVGTDAIQSTTKGWNASKFHGQTITWTRDTTSTLWTCASTFDVEYRPGDCTT